MSASCVYWKKILTEQEIKELSNFLEENCDEKKPDLFKAGGVTKKANTRYIKYENIKDKIYKAVNKVFELNKFSYCYDIDQIMDGEHLNYNIYKSEELGEYDWHIDKSSNAVYDIKFTLIINISDSKYEGGNFEVFENGPHSIDGFSEPGDILVLKANVNHRVTPVTKGERKSLVLFVIGPKFR